MTNSSAQAQAAPSEIARMITLPSEKIAALSGFLLIVTIVGLGFRIREHSYLSPESGIGYGLGIIGSSAMLLLLLYPARKHARWARHWGRVKYWFRAHMILGVAGPLLILYHCNFQLGSTNSNITLFSMLTVASSGIFGRYFYTRIHYGLYGRHALISELTSTQSYAESRLSEVFAFAPQLQHRIEQIGHVGRGEKFSFLIGGILMLWHYWSLQPALTRAYRVAAERKHWDPDTHQDHRCAAQTHLRSFLAASRKAREFGIYQRLFSLWHVFHVPLFVMLILSATVHVIAVHMY